MMADDREIQHANFILSIRWPDAAEGETAKYRPLIGEWRGATEWQKTHNGWRPVEWVTTIKRYLTPQRGPR